MLLIMRNAFQTIFGRRRAIIGVIHMPPLPGYPGFPGFAVTVKNAMQDLGAFSRGGMDGVMIENNYDQPHKIVVEPPVVAALTAIGGRLRAETNLPFGVNVLWNDYRAALGIAKALNFQFIRVPVFVDAVRASCGVIRAEPANVIAYRKLLAAGTVGIFVDIHVKHAKLLSHDSLHTSARKAIRAGADALVVTGDWTGQSPKISDLRTLRAICGSFPIFVGSGADHRNVEGLLTYADGIIVSTSVKNGGKKPREINIKSYKQRISESLVKHLIRAAKAGKIK